MHRRNFLLGCAGLGACAWADSTKPGTKSPVTLTGKLVVEDKSPLLKTAEGSSRLAAVDSYIEFLFAEPALAGRQVQVDGRWKVPGTLEVERLLTMRDGKLFRPVYFCDVCNITSYKPGPCPCCQGPLELREFPFDH